MCGDQVVQIRGIEPVKVCGIRHIGKICRVKIGITLATSPIKTTELVYQ